MFVFCHSAKFKQAVSSLARFFFPFCFGAMLLCVSGSSYYAAPKDCGRYVSSRKVLGFVIWLRTKGAVSRWGE